MAVSSGEVYALKSMVDLVCSQRSNEQDEISEADENGDEKKQVFGAENEQGNTPLHLAASASNWSVEMCEKIGSADPSFITRVNKAGETPLFLAALHGNNEAFLWLHYHSPQGSSSRHAPYKREDNDTILHCAIAGGNIDLAIDIVLLYKDHLKEMTMMRNKNGLSPVHLLAATPSAFESTDLPSRSFVVQLLYHLFFRVEKKEQATTEDELKEIMPEPCVDALIGALLDYVSSADDPAKGRSCCIGSIWLLIVFPLWVWAWVLIFLLVFLKLFLFLSAGHCFRGIRKMKEKHAWSLQIMEKLFEHGFEEHMSAYEVDSEEGTLIVETPLMTAAQNGVIEMVVKILEKDPSKVKDVNEEGKNIVLIAAEKRQTKLYQSLYGYHHDNTAFRQVDKDGNTALHLAVNLNWQTTTTVEEFKWFEFVKSSVPSELRERHNNEGKTAEEILRAVSEKKMTKDREWLTQTSQACSVVSTVVASMAFSNVTNNLDAQAHHSSLVSLSMSLTSTIILLIIVSVRSQSLKFWIYIPFMLHAAISLMLGSIASLWISLMVRHGKSLTTYAILGSPIAILSIVSTRLFIGPALKSMFTKVPPPNRNTTSPIHYRRTQKKENGAEFAKNKKRIKRMNTF